MENTKQRHAGKILIVLSGHDTLGDSGKPTGWWLSEVTHFYDVVTRAGFGVDIASPEGGEPAMDPASNDLDDPLNRKYSEDEAFTAKIKNTLSPEQVNPDDYRAIFYPGGHGPMWDLAEDKRIAGIARSIYEHGGVVSAVCHGPAGLLPISLSDGHALITGKKVTGLSNIEEKLVRKHKWVPFMLEDALQEKGAHYSKSIIPGISHIEVDGRLVTGQNPRSTKEVARAVVKLLKKTS